MPSKYLAHLKLLLIERETNRKIRGERHECKLLPKSVYKDFTSQKVETGLAITIRTGLDRDNVTDLHRLWDSSESRPFYRVTMASNRFKLRLRCMRFDHYRNRPLRQINNGLAANREVWETFNKNLHNMYVPNEDLMWMNNSWDNVAGFPEEHMYHQSQGNTLSSFFWLCKATTCFALNGIIYSGREFDSETHGNLANDIVMKLCLVHFGTVREIYVDRYFTSHSMVCSLLRQNLAVIGTIIANRREVAS